MWRTLPRLRHIVARASDPSSSSWLGAAASGKLGGIASSVTAGILVPASAVAALAIPPSAVKRLASPILRSAPDVFGVGNLAKEITGTAVGAGAQVADLFRAREDHVAVEPVVDPVEASVDAPPSGHALEPLFASEQAAPG
jgi:hypothetical protein